MLQDIFLLHYQDFRFETDLWYRYYQNKIELPSDFQNHDLLRSIKTRTIVFF